MVDLAVRHFPGRDGTRLAYRETGTGRPLVLLHGFFSSGLRNWVRSGFSAALAERGHRLILPDLRAHGDSAAPRDAAHYPPDVLTDDALALIEHLELADYDLGGYSLGARTVVRMLVRGAAPRRAVIAGQGLREVTGHGGTVARHLRHVFGNLGTFEPGSAEWKAERWLIETGGDPQALLHVLDSVVDTSAGTLTGIRVPALVVVGADDDRDGSAEALAGALPDGTHAVVPGNHTTAITAPELAEAVAGFLADQ
ncbi:alpha/beta fold hydrolase [Streptomyces sp. NRRL S-350]|uniref:alpha/beta fold hydrolase n=1 Tax=Streptomyces sp. NRRL S-350 TaxID=1463902 RepID=UPI0004BFE618|nr:alpha/beta fold hydrolase [Streptomyces sp. NRRL S-350]